MRGLPHDGVRLCLVFEAKTSSVSDTRSATTGFFFFLDFFLEIEFNSPGRRTYSSKMTAQSQVGMDMFKFSTCRLLTETCQMRGPDL